MARAARTYRPVTVSFSVARTPRTPEGLDAGKREREGLNEGEGQRQKLVVKEGEGLHALGRRKLVDQPSQQFLRAHGSSPLATSDMASSSMRPGEVWTSMTQVGSGGSM